MRRRSLPSFALASGLLLAACGTRSTATLSCDVPLGTQGYPHRCFEYAAAVTSDEAGLVSEGCVQIDMGTVVGSCPSANLLGTCARVLPGQVAQPTRPTAQLYYSDGGTTAEYAQLNCITTGGVWTGV